MLVLRRVLSLPQASRSFLFPIRSLTVGEKITDRRVFTRQDVDDFARLSGDNNPVHMDEEFAKKTIYGRCIVHGLLVTGMFSKMLGVDKPGTGTIYVQHLIKFKAPVYIGEEVEAVATVTKVRGKRAYMEARVFATERDNKMVIDGEAVCMLPQGTVKE